MRKKTLQVKKNIDKLRAISETWRMIKKTSKATLRDNIKYYRIKRGLTKSQLATLAGTTATTMIECGFRGSMPRYDTLAKISKALRVAIPDLYAENETKDRCQLKHKKRVS